MLRCEACAVGIEGPWAVCPLCGAATVGDATPSPFPDPPLRFTRRVLLRSLFLASLGLIAGSIAVQLIFRGWFSEIGVMRFVWLGVITMWLVVVMAVRKRRNIAKSAVYLVVIIGLFCAYWDYVTNWRAWSVTYAIPIMAASAVLAVAIVVRWMRVETGEHILYTGLAALLGLVPALFLVFRLVTNPVPSIVCVALSALALVTMTIRRRRQIRHELTMRLDL
ncbi:hypothetical protein SAMN06298212_104100 [Ruaniaceae bacterium KH17]|nr:hypothetical protein SAMN06298212_104100 [Ruaniaceae bacterium KH17]